MKALVFNGSRDIRYEHFADPTINNADNMIIKVQNCSICGSDLHMYRGGQIGKRDYNKPIEKFCTGHETIGEVVELGKNVNNHKIGDRVLIAPGTGCGKCQRCRFGQINMCEAYRTGNFQSQAYGLSPSLNGGQADYLEVIQADLGAATIPDGVTDEQALLLTDALATGYYGVKMSGVQPGDTVAVIGQGPVGRMAAEAALAIGAARVYAIDPVEKRRNAALLFGAHPIAPEEAVSQIMADTRGLGVDAVIEAVGVGPTLKQAVKLARLGGRLSILGILHADAVVPMNYAQSKSLVVHVGISGVVDMWPELIPLVQAGKVKGDGVFTHSFSLADGAEAFRIFEAQEDGVMKVLISP